MHTSDVNRVRREITQLVKGEADMRLVADAADGLDTGTVGLDRIVETGLIVAYCRPFTPDRRRRCPITLQYLTEDPAMLSVHTRLFELRDTVYAHSDETEARVAVDPFGQHSYTDAYRPLGGLNPRDVATLARDHESSFRRALTEREEALREAGVLADPSIP